jgi:asparagine synthase (glutamine-hydrolysing)
MPGLIVVADARGADEAQARHARGRERMLRHGGLRAHAWTTSGGACLVGHVSLTRHVNAAEPSTTSVIDGVSVIFHGVLHNERELGPQFGVEAVDRASTLAALYARDGEAFIARLEGEFCLAVLDDVRRRLIVATDPVGNYPLYWAQDSDGLVAASELGALLRARASTATLDIRAVADYLTIGSVFGDKTLASGVRMLPPGSMLTYGLANRSVSIATYSRLESLFEPKVADHSAYLQDVEAAFAGAVARASTTTETLGLSLSGGLDSRGLLAMIPGEKSRVRTYTLGVQGCADQVIGEQLAAMSATQHRFFELDASYLRDFLPNMAAMVSLTDGMYLSHGLTEMLAVRFLEDTDICVLLRGHGGELAKANLAWPLHTDARVHAMRSLDELVPYLSARANYITPELPLKDIFAPDVSSAAGIGARSSFAEALTGTRLSPADACSFLYLRELNRRFTVPSLELFRTRVDVRLPFLDIRYLKALLASPPAWRDGTTIHQRLIGAGDRRLLGVRNSNTGARVNAWPLEERLLERLSALLKRLNVTGYRHYHNFDGWMRSMLLGSVESELLAPGARVQAFVPRAVLERLLRESRDGVADRSYLLQVLLILELWQRENQVEGVA